MRRTCYQFGPWTLDEGQRGLLRGSERVHLSRKAFDLLDLLLAAQPNAVSKQEIQDRLWPRTFVSEASITKLMAEIRGALDEDPHQPRLIRTVHGFGYAFCGATTTEPLASGVEEEVAAERSPYPGLAAFAERDAPSFFGREAEVEALWDKLRRRKLLGLIGPSGVGKTSFLRAGVLAHRPRGWACLLLTPGPRPPLALARVLVSALSGEASSIERLLSLEQDEIVAVFSGWRRQKDEALLVVDQLEELFTSNPPEAQAAFAACLGRLVAEADIHLLLSVRDDFLFPCHDHVALRDVFADLTPLGPLKGHALERALVEPAGREGYRFEDESLVKELLTSVEGGRGTLPLLAFAAARLWEKRDRDRKVLTRAAYAEIGGVAGALAQHAEATLEQIGTERWTVVRDIFRGLVTARGTRAVGDRDELLSAFRDREGAAQVLHQLVDARLLTSYELTGADGGAGCHRIEVVHESLLGHWPRLVRWRAQDAEGALLRDQLKQAAHLWDEKGRTPDLLWTGAAYREFVLWWERYPGALSGLEQDFARSTTERARRQRRLRWLAAGAVVTAAVLVAAAMGVLWRRSDVARERAQTAALHAEASKLIALGRAELERYPSAAVAYARRSLEVADTPEGRQFVVEALWRSPTARILPVDPPAWGAALSPDDRWLAAFTFSENVLLWGADGRLVRTIGGHRLPGSPPGIAFTPGGEALLTWSPDEPRVRVLSVPEGQETRWLPTDPPRAGAAGGPSLGYGSKVLRGGLLVIRRESRADRSLSTGVDVWPYDGGPPSNLGSWRPASGSRAQDAGDTHVVFQRGRRIVLRPVAGPAAISEREVGLVVDAAPPAGRIWPALRLSPTNDRVAVAERDGRLAVFSAVPGAPREPRVYRIGRPESQFAPAFDAAGARLLWGSSAKRRASVFDLEGPPDAEPLALVRPDAAITKAGFFDHAGRWAVVVNSSSLTFWAVRQPHVRVLPEQGSGVGRLVFTRDARWLLSCANDGIRAWPLAEGRARGLDTGGNWCYGLAVAPDGGQVLSGGPSGAFLAPFSGAPGRWLHSTAGRRAGVAACAFDGSGQRAAAAAHFSGDPGDKVVRVWDLRTREVRVLPLVPAGETGTGYDWAVSSLAFSNQGRLYAGGYGGVRWFDPETAASEWLWHLPRDVAGWIAVSADGRRLAAAATKRNAGAAPAHGLVLIDLASGGVRRVHSHGQAVVAVGLDPSGRMLVSGDEQGAVRVGRADGSEPHLLLGHSGPVSALAVSPDGAWIASASGGEIRLWPMPDVSRPPLHAQPYAELMTTLRAMTNLQAVADAASASGYRIEVGPFPGWRDVPSW